MHYFYSLVVLFTLSIPFVWNLTGQSSLTQQHQEYDTHPTHNHAPGEFCAHSKARSKYPAVDRQQKALDKIWSQQVKAGTNFSGNRASITLPVVFHVIHNNGPANISDAQVQTSLANLNAAFANTGVFNPATGVDVDVDFCLAQQDPAGVATNGITRTVSTLTDMDLNTDDIAVKNLSRWSPTEYINIWIVNEICDGAACGVAGYAYLPGAHGLNMDGIVVEASFTGTSVNADKVLVHEMGHYLGLEHTFEGGCTNNDCTADNDLVCDTPPDDATVAIACNTTTNTCTTDEDDASANNPFRAIALGGLGEQNDMIENYMDYGFQSCQDRFTQGQKDRMLFFINGIRASLLASNACQAVVSCPTPIVAGISASATTTSIGGTVNFTNTSTGATTYDWTINGTSFATSTNSSFNFTTAGNFQIILVADNGNAACTDRDTVNVTVSSCPVAAYTTTSNTFFINQPITFTNTSSVGATTFNWTANGAAFSTSANPTQGFAAGAYNICLTVTDGASCSDVVCSNITVAGNPETRIDTAVCAGTTYQHPGTGNTYAIGTVNDTIRLTSSFGTDSLVIVTVTGLPTSTSTVDTFVCAGQLLNYNGQNLAANTSTNFTLTNAQGCDSVVTVNVAQADTFRIALDTFVCPGGSLTIAGQNLTVGMSAATVLTTAQGCDSTIVYTVREHNVTTATAIQNALNITGVSCANAQDGQATINLTSGNTPYTYSWSSGQTGSTAAALNGGNYSLTATDANSCAVTYGFFVPEPLPLSLSLNASDASCATVNDGTVSSSVNGGTTPYTYAWSNGATTANLTSLNANNYTLTLTDDNNCTAIQSAAVGLSANAVQAQIISSQEISCFGANDGTALVDAAQGTPNYTYLWSDGTTTAQLTGAGRGTYTVTVTDQTGCQAVTSINFIEPAELNISAQITSNYNGAHISCFGEEDASAEVIVSGGTSGYTYAWSNGMNTDSIQGLGAGTYYVTVTDLRGCFKVDSIVLVEPLQLDATTTTVDVNCTGDQNGQIVVTAIAGTGTLGVNGYEYTIAGPNQSGNVYSTVNTFTALDTGNYALYIRDGNNCGDTLYVRINDPGAIVIDSFITVQPTCNAGNDGTITVVPSGGNQPYGYQWNNGGTTQTITGLSAGTFDVTVTDSKGCAQTGSSSVTLTDPTVLQASVTTSNVSCLGGNNGFATVVATGGNAPYTYNWGDGDSTNATELLLSAGAYDVTVTDRNGCQLVESFVITEPSTVVTATGTQTPISCNGQADATATVIPAGGTPGYTYIWNTLPVQTTATATGLNVGIYTCIVTDSLGCTFHYDVTITEPTALTTTMISAGNLSCFGAGDGTATVLANGGTTPYTYLWSSGDTLATATNLGAGMQYVTVTDLGGCQRIDSVFLTEPTEIEIGTIITTHVDCKGGSNGTALISPDSMSGGTLPYNFTWSMNSSTTINAVSDLSAGMYYVTITDLNGCEQVDSFEITEPATALSSFTRVTPALCNGANSGEMTVIASGGTPASTGYTYLWSNGETTDVVDSVGVGIYYVTITDSLGCTTLDTAVIDEASPIVVSIISSTDVSCFGGNDGSAVATATGGTMTSNYSYVWSDPSAQSGNIATNLSAGTYTVVVTDVNGCTGRDSVVINDGDSIRLTTVVENVSCNGLTDGSIEVTNSSTPINGYIWSHTPINLNPVTGLAAGTYGLTVTATNGCQQSYSYEVTEPDSLTLTFEQLAVNDCYGDSNASVVVRPIGGTMNYSYAWSAPAVSTDTLADSLPAGTYQVTITDANNCTVDTQFTIQHPTQLNANPVASNTTCPEDANGTISVAGIGGTVLSGLYEYSIDSVNWQTGDFFDNLVVGEYTVYIKDDLGCIEDTMLTIESEDSLYITAFLQDTVIEYFDSIDLTVVLSDTVGVNFAWMTLDPAVDTLTTDSLIYGIVPKNNNRYYFTAVSALGCMVDSVVNIDVIKPRRANAPTAFTPNGDGVNEIFYLQGDSTIATVTSFKIFDRWGNLVFDQAATPLNNPDYGWNGYYKGKLMNSGVYTYYAVIRFEDEEDVVVKGDVTLLR